MPVISSEFHNLSHFQSVDVVFTSNQCVELITFVHNFTLLKKNRGFLYVLDKSDRHKVCEFIPPLTELEKDDAYAPDNETEGK